MSDRTAESERVPGPRVSGCNGLSLRCHELDTATVIAVDGEVDIATCELMKTAIDEARATGKPAILDLSGMSFMDSTGLSVLVQAHKASERQTTADLYLAALQPMPARLLKITNLVALLRTFPTVQAAVQAATREGVHPGGTAR